MDTLTALATASPTGFFGWLALALAGGFAVAWWLRGIDCRRRQARGLSIQKAALRARLDDAEERATRLSDTERRRRREVKRLGARMAAQASERDRLAARIADVAERDRQELIRLQEELESDLRIGAEKARLIRSLTTQIDGLHDAARSADLGHQRLRVSLSALAAALTHAKRGRERCDAASARLRERLRERLPLADGWAAPDPADRIVYRDREVTIEVPIEVPVGFTALPTPPGGTGQGRRPTYSEKRPSSP